ncbi:hypothetical protein BDW74DRAFT_179148 [Aspergillus multicolor]|uniref:uncharacterized protein n=1 Tax=Aspergillus multicolor TaxID=41759 RepID=UPI003CCCB166
MSIYSRTGAIERYRVYATLNEVKGPYNLELVLIFEEQPKRGKGTSFWRITRVPNESPNEDSHSATEEEPEANSDSRPSSSAYKLRYEVHDNLTKAQRKGCDRLCEVPRNGRVIDENWLLLVFSILALDGEFIVKRTVTNAPAATTTAFHFLEEQKEREIKPRDDLKTAAEFMMQLQTAFLQLEDGGEMLLEMNFAGFELRTGTAKYISRRC